MTSTVERPASRARRRVRPGAQPGPGPTSSVMATPPRPRRRWGVFAAMAGVVCLGALGNVWLHQVTNNAREVVAARVTIERGSLITRDELMSVQIGTDPAVRSVPADGLDRLVGQRAAVDVAAGSLLTGGSVTAQNVPGRGYSLVGVGVMPAMMPGAQLTAGDRIRVVGTPGQLGEATPGTTTGTTAGMTAAPVEVAAVVVSTVTGADTTGLGSQTLITVEVPVGDAAALASMAATGKVAVVLDSRDR